MIVALSQYGSYGHDPKRWDDGIELAKTTTHEHSSMVSLRTGKIAGA